MSRFCGVFVLVDRKWWLFYNWIIPFFCLLRLLYILEVLFMKRTFLLLTILACLFVVSYAMADTLTLPAELTVIEEEAFFGASSFL